MYGLPGPGPSLPFTRELSTAIAQLKLVRGGLQRTLTPGERDMTVNEAYEILRGNDAVINRFMTTTHGASDRTGVLPDLGGRVAGGTDLATTRSLIVDQANLTVQNADAESRRFLDMVSQLLRTFRSVDGRKTVMLFSEGFHTDNISRSLKDVAAAAAETYSVIYSFDLNKRSESLSTVMPTGSDVAPEISNRLESLSLLSADTNGKVILDASSHLDQALDVVGAAELDYYIIGFAAPAAALTNRDEYRHVSVRVTRPGAHVSTRTGYVTGPAQTPADRRRAIDAALRAPFSQQGLRVEYTTYVGQSEHPGFQGVAVSLQTELPVAARRHGRLCRRRLRRPRPQVRAGPRQRLRSDRPAPSARTGFRRWAGRLARALRSSGRRVLDALRRPRARRSGGQCRPSVRRAIARRPGSRRQRLAPRDA